MSNNKRKNKGINSNIITQQKLTGKRDFRVKLENMRIPKREPKIKKKRVQRENNKRKVKKT
ncbi:hypothetical protein CNEO4_750013 [Clostridium neonatale]|nr:hypothetical protein CNEO4_750013 [Clostridium neonatale]